MTAISTLSQNLQMQQYMLQELNQENTVAAQISTGLVSSSYSGLAPQASTIVNLTAQQSQDQAYLGTITTLNTRMSTMSGSMNDIQNLVSQFAQGFTTDAYNTSGGSATVQTEAKQLLSEVESDLNVQDGSGYVFSGYQTSSASFNASALPNPGNLATANTAYYGGDNNVQQATIDQNTTISYGVTANNPAFEQIVRALNFIANSGSLSQSNPTDVANVSQASQLLTNGLAQLQTLQGNLGLQQSQVASTATNLSNSMSLGSTTLSNIEQVNSATAITQLNTIQTQLEASYQTVNILQQSSLVNYLK
jgi:flagellar hook-associated protein 3 FlgL